MTKKQFRLFVGFLLLIVLLAAGTLAVAATNESMQRRIAAVPHYARSYLRQWRPTVVPPTPPPVSALDRQQLLALAAEPLTATPQPALPPTFTPIPLLSATPVASLTPSLTPTATPTPTPSNTPFPLTPAASSVSLEGVTHAFQMWNNCGPTTVTMNLSFYGLQQHQREAARILKPVADDKNVSPEQIVSYVQTKGFEAVVRIGGDAELLRRFLSNGFPVIVETWILPDDNGGMGHYRLVTGYDDSGFLIQDSYFGRDKQLSTAVLDEEWRVFNRKFIVVYPPAEKLKVEALLGPLADDSFMLQHVLETAQAEARATPEDAFAWHNLGAVYTALGQSQQAATAFDEARRIRLPLRMLWYQFEMFQAYLDVGRYQDVIDLAYNTAYTASGHEEAYYYRALAHLGRDEPGYARSYLLKALEYNEHFEPAAQALAELGG